MAKDLGAEYEAGRRGSSWLKIKRALSLDLVVLAAEWGHGRRHGYLSNLHLGARDPENGAFVMLGKTFKGMTDEMLGWQTRKLLELETSRDAYAVYVRPELVVDCGAGRATDNFLFVRFRRWPWQLLKVVIGLIQLTAPEKGHSRMSAVVRWWQVNKSAV